MLAKQAIRELKEEFSVDEVTFIKSREGIGCYEVFLSETYTDRTELEELILFFTLMGTELLSVETWKDKWFEGTTWELKTVDGRELTIALEA